MGAGLSGAGGCPDLIKPSGRTAEVFNPKAAEQGREKVRTAYRPAHVARYHDAEGRPVGYVLRRTGRRQQVHPQVTWAIPPMHPPARIR